MLTLGEKRLVRRLRAAGAATIAAATSRMGRVKAASKPEKVAPRPAAPRRRSPVFAAAVRIGAVSVLSVAVFAVSSLGAQIQIGLLGANLQLGPTPAEAQTCPSGTVAGNVTWGAGGMVWANNAAHQVSGASETYLNADGNGTDVTVSYTDPANRNGDLDNALIPPYDAFYTETDGLYGNGLLTIVQQTLQSDEVTTWSIDFSKPVFVDNLTVQDIDWHGVRSATDPASSFEDELVVLGQLGSGAGSLNITPGGNVTNVGGGTFLASNFNSPYPTSGNTGGLANTDPLGHLTVDAVLPITNFSFAYSNGPNDAVQDANHAASAPAPAGSPGVSDSHAIALTGFTVCSGDLDIGDRVWSDADGDGVQDAGESGLAGVTLTLLDGGGNVVETTNTDASGNYSFTSLVPWDWTVTATPPAGYTATFDRDGGLDSTADVDLNTPAIITAGGITDMDFGFRPDPLTVTKTSDAGGSLEPGDTLTYTVEVVNNGVLEYTNVVVTDPLPAGTTYVAESTSATWLESTSMTPATEDWESTTGAWVGGSGPWLNTAWTEIGETNGANSGDTRVITHFGDRSGRVRDNDNGGEGFERSIDLSSFSTATLDYDYFRDIDDNDSTEYVTVEVRPNGGTFTELARYEFFQDTTYQSETLDLTPFISGNTTIRFISSTGLDGDQFVLFDDIEVNASSSSLVTRTNVATDPTPLDDGVPTNLITTGDGINLQPGETLTITYSVFVDEPNAADDVVNIATASSDQTLPESATRTDPLFEGSISDFVWNDLNADGIQDSGEPGLGGVQVELLRGANVLMTTTTAADGSYEFDGLRSGGYRVRFTLPANYNFSPSTQGADPAVDSDPDVVTGVTGIITLGLDEDDDSIDAGMYTNATISDFVWDDLNGDGIQDSGEQSLENVTIELLDSVGTVVDTTTTNASGLYSFSVVPGTYSVRVTYTGTDIGSPQDQGGDDGLDSDADPTDGESAQITVASGEVVDDLDFGIITPGVIGDLVFDDLNGNGIQDGSEAGIGGVTVELLNGGSVVDTTTTATTGTIGSYSFTGLVPGDYVVRFTNPGGTYRPSPQGAGGDAALDSDADQTTGETATITVVSGTDNDTIDAGFYEPLSIGDRVWLDTDGDGIQDAGERGVAGVTVRLLDGSGTVLATTVTAADGTYGFADLDPGQYRIEVLAPGFTFTSTDAGADDTVDSDVDGLGQTALLTLAGSTDDDTIDAGILPSTLGDLVWDDLNGNGVQDGGEPGISGVTVNLLDSGGVTIDTTTTDGSGAYSFPVGAGSYQVEFVLPGTMEFTTPGLGGDASADSNADAVTGRSATITVTNDTDDLTIDAGMYTPVTLGDRVWEDINANGIFDGADAGLSGVTVQLRDSGGTVIATDTTDGSGLYAFTDLAPGDYSVVFVPPTDYFVSPQDQGGDDAVDSDPDATTGITGTVSIISGADDDTVDAGMYQLATVSDFVWVDLDSDGIQDAGEPGLAGVTVNLRNTSNVVVGTTVTSGTGSYVLPSILPGDYTVEFVAPGYTFTGQDQGGDDTVDSDADSSGVTASINLVSGEDDDTVDAGVLPMNLGDFVWDDTNGNGVQDGGETGISGVTVELLDSGGLVIDTTTTAGDGSYNFSVAAGTYAVRFTEPAGYSIGAQDQGGNDATDSDPDSTTGTTGAVVVTGPADVLDVDAGLFRVASVSDFVWNDLDADGIQDAGEPGLDGVVVELRDSGGTLVATDTTAGGGAYAFTGLTPGDYTITFVAPVGAAPSPQDAGGDDDLDSDIDALGVVAVTLSSAEDDDTVDSGFVTPGTIGNFVWDDLDGDGVQDAGEPGVDGVTVELLDDLGAVVDTAVTAGGGLYQFTGVTPGAYSVRFVEPVGATLTGQDNGGDDNLDSDASVATGETATFTIVSGGSFDVDAGLLFPASLGDFVWFDTDGNGIQDSGEPGVAGVTVELLDGLGAVIGSTTTNASGAYSFNGLAPGDYSVRLPDSGLVFTGQDVGGDDALDSDVDGAGASATVTLTSGQTNDTVDAGILPSSISDFVWNDLNGNGIQDSGEPGVDGVTVELRDGGGSVIASTTTTGGGAYLFDLLLPGNYSVAFTAPVGFGITTQDAGGDDALDSDADASGVTATIALAGDTQNMSVDAGLFQPVTIGDFVWDDLDGDGIQDGGEPGLGGVSIELRDGGGGVVATTSSAGDGSYSFTNVIPGDYTVEFTAPAGAIASGTDQGGDDNLDSDVNASGVASITVVSGTSDFSIDAGFLTPITIGDLVWDDLDGDGIQDAGEPGVGSVAVDLLDGAGTVVASTTTAGDGSYTFTGVDPGTYRVRFTPTGVYGLTLQDQGADDDIDSDASTVNGETALFTVISGDVVDNVDAGLLAGASVSNFVWFDTNGDGVQDGGEPGAGGVTVELLDNGGAVVASTVTLADGTYSFGGLTPGVYSVRLPDAGLVFTSQDVGGNDSLDSDVDASGLTASTVLISGEADDTIDAGILPSSIGDFVWDDLNGNGVQDGGEPGIGGVAVALLDAGGSTLATTTTAADGSYLFDFLLPGTYQVQFTAPGGTVVGIQDAGSDDALDSDPDGTGLVASVVLPGNTQNDSVDAALFTPIDIGDFVWDDLDGDGVQDAGEPGLDGVVVELRDSSGTLVATDTTSGGGTYGFTGLAPGDYTLTFVAPVGASPTGTDAGANDAVDSDVDGSGVVAVSLVSGTSDMTFDAGFVTPASIGDLVWDDLDGDGVQDSGEPGVDGVSAELLDNGGTVVDTAVTAGGGLYQFTGVAPGTYSVRFTAPVGAAFTAVDAGANDALDSDADLVTGETPPFATSSGQSITNLDAGLVTPASIGDRIWFDLDGNGVQDAGEVGAGGVVVALRNGAGAVIATTSTLADGSYSFTNIAPGTYSISVPGVGLVFTGQDQGVDDTVDSDTDGSGITADFVIVSGQAETSVDIGLLPSSIGNFVWEDLNGNGVQDFGEPGVAGVSVDLLNGSGTVLASTTTAADGSYLFNNLLPGTYEVRFNPLAGHDRTIANAGGDDAVDSDAAVATGLTGSVVLAADTQNDTVDAGLYQPTAIGDFVWTDANGNGLQDGSELGLGGVTIELRDGGGALVGTTTSAADGSYSFTNLAPGDYTITFAALPGQVPTLQDQGVDDALDSDINASGTASITLVSGTPDTTIDAGFVTPVGIGDFVWDDLNANGVQDSGEPGVDGVTVELLDLGGTVLGTTITSGGGAYLFDPLAPGGYQVRFTTPAGYTLTSQDLGGDDTTDSDADATGVTAAVTVTSGAGTLDIDAGIYQPVAIGDFVWDDLDADGVQDAGEPGIAGVLVEVRDSGGAVVGSDTTVADGSYSVTGLVPGDYTVTFTGPVGSAPTAADQGGDDSLDSDVNASGVASVTLTSGSDDLTIDAGFVTPATIGDFVWDDLNGDGIQDGGEPGIGGVAVELLDGGGFLIASTTTAADGSYSFAGVAPGTYSVRFTPTGAYAVTAQDAGADDAVDSDPATGTGETAPFTVTSGQNLTTIDAGMVATATISDLVWFDENGNGIQDAGEPGVAGIAVDLRDSGGTVIASTTTAADGTYSFANLAPGTYSIALPGTGLVFTGQDAGADDAVDSDVDASGLSGPIVLISAQVDSSVDAGILPSSISDFVWDDLNGNGIQDSGEPGIDGVTVELLDGGGATLATTTTSGGGAYLFDNLLPADYQVRFTAPVGFDFTVQDAGADDVIDSDANVSTGLTSVFALAGDTQDNSLDAGLFQTLAIGDFVWDDLNGNGVQDGGEPGLAGVSVEIRDASNSLLGSTTTAADGSYAFSGLVPGDYTVTFIAPVGATPTSPNAGGDDALDSDIDAAGNVSVSLVSGTPDMTIDAGFLTPASVGDFVWEDLNGNGVQDSGEPGVVVDVDLLDAGSGTVVASTTTAADGSYSFTNVAPGTYRVRFSNPSGYQITAADLGGDDAFDSDANQVSGETPDFTVISGNAVTNLDAGIYQPVAIGDFVWDDLDADGVQDAGEPGIAGVLVEVRDSGGAVVGSDTTVADGSYSVTGLVPGDYTVTFTGPVGSAPTAADQGGDDSLDSDVNASGVASVTLTSGSDDLTIDAGFVTPATIGNFVWEDVDGDGQQGITEPGVGGVTVELLDSIGSVVGTTTTAADGSYSFAGVAPGTYSVRFTPSGVYGLTAQDAGGDDALDSDADPVTGETAQFTVASGQNQDSIDAGLIVGASLGDFVWFDLNGDGVQTSGEPGVAGVAVDLVNLGGTIIASTTTAVDGSYSFGGLTPGLFRVQFPDTNLVFTGEDLGGDDTLDSDVDASGESGIVVLSSGEVETSVDAGILPSSIGDFVWEDLNGNGVQDSGEPGLAGVTVELLDGVGALAATTTTSGGGSYLFDNLLPGNYQVRVTAPAGYDFTGQDAGGDDAVDSDVDAFGITATISLAGDTQDDSVDAGLYQPVTIGDFVFDDVDGDGVQDSGEPGIDGLTVELRDAGGTVVATTNTATGGAYSFTGVVPGDYTVTFEIPAGATATTPDSGGDDALDSDVDIAGVAPITVVSGTDDLTVDAGFLTPTSVGDFVWDDVNGNGVQESGEPGVVTNVDLLDAVSGLVVATTATAADGSYSFTNVVPGTYRVRFSSPPGYEITTVDAVGDDTLDSDADPITGETADFTITSGQAPITDLDGGLYRPASVSDFVWDDLNANGVQDSGEPGIGGVLVEVRDGGGTVVGSDTTAGDGSYLVGGLAPGTYTVTFTAPVGSAPTSADQGGDDTLDSDIDGAGVSSLTLSSGELDSTIDAGFVTPATIGDFVWDDLNGDGIQTSGEPGVSGVTVELLDGGGSVIVSTTTAADGSYSFAGVAPGTYSVRFTPTGPYGFTTLDAGGDDALDSDANPGDGTTAPFTVTSGQTQDSIDAGLVAGASIGDFVWLDSNGDGVQDAGEPGAAGVAVDLLNFGGTIIASTTTAVDGSYSFGGLTPGAYRIQVPGTNLVFTGEDLGGNDGLDSDVDASGLSGLVILSSGEVETSVDAGILPSSISDVVWEDLNGNGVQDSGEPGIDGVTVELLDGAGTLITTTTTAGGGLYSFANLLPADYQVQVTAPAGYDITVQDAGADDAVDSDIDASGLTAVFALAGNSQDDSVDAGLYQPASIGDFVWVDLNGDDIQTAGEPGLAGITVNLLNGGGTQIATTVTGASGVYAFTGLTPGSYQVEVVAPGFSFVGQDVGGNDAVDSDVNPADGLSGPITLTSAQTDSSVDAGLDPASIGDFVFSDLNGDGIQDGGEPGLGGVVVNLLDAGGAQIASTVTGPAGDYAFIVAPGTYEVEFVAPGGSAFSSPNQGGDDSVDSDADAITGRTGPIVISGSTPDISVDAGLVAPATLGDFVWQDINGDGIQDGGEPGLDGVTVNLLDSGGATVATTVTAAGGAYSFTVAPGSYTVDIGDSTVPGGYVLTTTDPLPVTVTSGQTVDTLDFGYQPTGAIEIIKDPATQVVVSGGAATFNITVNNTGLSAADNVTVTDALAPGCNNTLGTIAAGGSATYSCSLSGITANFTNSATVTADGPGGISLTDTDTADVTVDVPGISIVKDPANQSVVTGGTATFNITVTNTGATALTGVTVTDPLSPDCDQVVGDLAVGANSSYACVLTNVTADFTNTASVTANDPLGNPQTDSDTALVDAIAPAIEIIKDPASQTVLPGGTATFNITVTNIGDAPLTGVAVTDPLAPLCDNAIGDLAIGASVSYSCTLAGVTAGFTNTATAIGTDPTSNTVSDDDSADVLLLAPSVGIVKDPATQTIVSGGTAIFNITVTNTGDADLSNVIVSDPSAPLCDNTVGSLAIGATASYTCTLSGVAGSFTNTANVAAEDPAGNPLAASDTADVVVISPGIEIVKDPATQDVLPGATATFNITVTNTGDVALTNVVVSDPLAPLCDNTIGNMAIGASQSYSCTLAGVNADFINTASVTGLDPVGGPVGDADTADVTVVTPSLSIVKDPASQTIVAGGTATFNITVTNNGDVDLTSVVVSDPLAPLCDNTIGNLAIGASQSYSCALAGVGADFTNTATVTGLDPASNPVTASDTAAVDVISPSIQIVKDPAAQAVLAGGTANFNITVTNTGDADLTNVAVTDPLAPLCDNIIGNLTAGASTSYSCTLSPVTGAFTNTANVSGLDPFGSPVTSTDTADVTVLSPGIQIVKDTTTPQVVLGGTATFTITVTNTGTADLTNVNVVDAQAPLCDNVIGNLAAGASTSYSCDLAGLLGDITNSATVFGTDSGGTISSSTDVAPVDVISPEILISKTPNNQSVIINGTANFNITVTNAGDVPLTGVAVADALSPNCDNVIGDLAAGADTTYACTLSPVTGPFINSATVTGTHPVTGPIQSTDTADVSILTPGINISKTADDPVVTYGSDASFTIVVSNSGQTDLVNVVVSDPLAPACDNTIGNLAVGGSVTYSCVIPVLTADVTNVATANGEDTVGNPVTSTDSDDVSVITPVIDIAKTPDLQQILAGADATFTITVTNQGDVPLSNVVVTDPLAPDCDRTLADLAAGASDSYTCTLLAVPADFTNTATVDATDPLGGPVTDSDDAAVDIVNPGIDIQKTPDTQQVLTGTAATFTITVTNNGDQDIADASISDPLSPLCDVASTGALAVGGVFTYACDSDPLTVGITNIAQVTGVDVLGNPVSDSDDAAVVVLNPDLTIDKTPDAQAVVVNGTANFTITVANPGDADLVNVSVSDPLSPSCDNVIGALAAGTSTTYSCTLSPVPADFTNTANVTGEDPFGNTLTAADVADVTVLTPGIDIVKDASYQIIPVGGTANFTITVTNSGQTPLTAVIVSDPLSPGCDNTIGDLAVGASTSYTCSLASVAADFINEATATGTDPVGNPWSDSNTAIVDVIAPGLTIQKTPDTQTVLAGSDVTFSITVTNTGDSLLTGVAVTDALTPGCDLAIGDLAAGASSTHTCIASAVPASFTNVAEASGTDIGGNTLTVQDDADVVVVPTGSVTGLVFLDSNANGVFDAETLLGGVQVDLVDSLGAVVAATTTDPSGEYRFDNVPIGDYTVDVMGSDPNIPAAHLLTTANDPQPVTVLASTETRGTDVGYAPPAILAGRAFIDSNSNGIDDGEPGLASVTVNVWVDTVGDGSPDTIVRTTLTAADGTWNVDALLPNNYFVEYVQPAGQIATAMDVGGDDTIDSDIDPVSGLIALVTLPPGGLIGDLDAGYYTPVVIGDTVYSDTDSSGTQDPAEIGLPGVDVTATWAGPDGVLGNGDDQVLTQTTGAGGNYLFTNVPPGLYSVEVIEPLGITVTTGNDPHQITLAPGASNLDADFGLNGSGVLTGAVYEDLNNDGIRQPGEPGISGVAIRLTGTDLNSLPVDITATTDVNGDYVFTNLLGGTYELTETQPAGFTDGIDSAGTAGGDASVNDVISNIVFPAGFSGVGYNFGELRESSISGSVVTTTGAPIGGVTVTLTGTDDLGAAVNATAVTDAAGDYVFLGLRPGDYTVTESQPLGYGEAGETPGTSGGTAAPNVISGIALAPNTAASGYVFTEATGSLSGTVYVDNDLSGGLTPGDSGINAVTVTLNGSDVTGATIFLTTTTLVDGTYRFDGLLEGTYAVSETQPGAYVDSTDTVGSLGGDASINDTIGNISVPAGGVGTSYDFAEVGTGISGTVWLDLNNDGVIDAGEIGLPGVVIALLDSAGTTIATTTTLPDGTYSFDGLVAGDYVVQEQQPAEWGSSTPNSIAVTLTAAGAAGLDFGEKPGSISGIVFGDIAGDGDSTGDVGVGGIPVTLTDSTGTVIGTTTTAPDGSYQFTGLPTDTYSVVITTPADQTLSPNDAVTDDTVDSDFNPVNSAVSVTLSPGQDTTDIDGGITAIAVDVAVVVTVPDGTYDLNENIPFTVTASNTGNVPTDGGVNVVMPIPPGAVLVSATGTDWVVTQSGASLTAVYTGTTPMGSAMPAYCSDAAPCDPWHCDPRGHRGPEQHGHHRIQPGQQHQCS